MGEVSHQHLWRGDALTPKRAVHDLLFAELPVGGRVSRDFQNKIALLRSEDEDAAGQAAPRPADISQRPPGKREDGFNVFRTGDCVTLLNCRRLPNRSKLNAMVAGERLPVIVLPQPDWERDAAREGDTLPLATWVKMQAKSADFAKNREVGVLVQHEKLIHLGTSGI